MEKKTVKKQMNHVIRAIVFYNIILVLVVLVDAIIKTVRIFLQYSSQEQINQAVNELTTMMEKSGTSSIVGVAIGFLFLLFCFRKDHLQREMFFRKRRPSLKIWLALLCLMMATQFIFTAASEVLEAGFHLFGYTLKDSVEAATGTSSTLSMFLYASIVGPVVEELVYRGFVLRSLQRYGKTFAIVMSAFIFGMMHGNLLQSLFAFLVGIIFAYAALEYSIYVSMGLHIINNCLFGDVFGWLTKGMSEMMQTILYGGCITAFFAGGCWLVLRNRSQIRSYWKENTLDSVRYRYAFTAIWMVIFIIMEIYMMSLGIKKI